MRGQDLRAALFLLLKANTKSAKGNHGLGQSILLIEAGYGCCPSKSVIKLAFLALTSNGHTEPAVCLLPVFSSQDSHLTSPRPLQAFWSALVSLLTTNWSSWNATKNNPNPLSFISHLPDNLMHSINLSITTKASAINWLAIIQVLPQILPQ